MLDYPSHPGTGRAHDRRHLRRFVQDGRSPLIVLYLKKRHGKAELQPQVIRMPDGLLSQRLGSRQRLLDAHKIAGEFFREQLLTPAAAAGRQFLAERGFDRDAAEHFGVGFAPQGWDALLKHLTGKGFSHDELKLTGMFSEGQRGIYDRFRGRLIWPIRDIAGDTVGFGARRLFEDDQGPKYLNTPETVLYKKSQVLYGIDLAKKSIASKRQLVVVEGYTDVMACHLAGVDTAVATCGTAFGADHIKVSRRLLSDDGTGGEVVFTFDGDAAGQKAALKAFDEDQRFVAQTFVAVEPSGADPCELRQTKGDEAVHALIRSRRPLFEFAIRSTLAKFDLSTVEGRVSGLRASAPVVAAIRDGSTRMGYSQELAGCQSRLMECSEVSNETLHEMSERTEKLIGLRSTVYRSPTWPFRNASAALRVLLAAMSPLLYFVLNELVRTYMLPLLGVR